MNKLYGSHLQNTDAIYKTIRNFMTPTKVHNQCKQLTYKIQDGVNVLSSVFYNLTEIKKSHILSVAIFDYRKAALR